MLIEQKCSRTHVQLFVPATEPGKFGDCVCTVRIEYAEAVKAAIEAQLASVAKGEANEHAPD